MTTNDLASRQFLRPLDLPESFREGLIDVDDVPGKFKESQVLKQRAVRIRGAKLEKMSHSCPVTFTIFLNQYSQGRIDN